MGNRLKDIDVLILCGGLGKRLKKISGNIPKPMVKIGKRRFLDIVIDYLAGFGFRRFILATGYKADLIEDYYSGNSNRSKKILFSREKVPLGTGGGVKNARRLINSDKFFVLNGDSFCRFNPGKLLSFHRKKKALVSILLIRELQGKDYGEIKIDKSLRILSFNEKPQKAKRCLINAGVYIFDKKAFGLMPREKMFSLERDFFPAIAGKNIFGYRSFGFFIDIGTPKRFLRAGKYLAKHERGLKF